MKSTIRKTSRAITAAAGSLMFLLFTPPVLAEGLTLQQCANGGVTDPVDHLSCHEGWISGNAGKTKAAYTEGSFLPYRVELTGLSPGATYTYAFSWDTFKSGKHAIDYIGTYNHNVTGADPCDGVAGCPWSSTTTLAIPVDPVVSGMGVTQVAGHMTLFGGTLVSVGPYDLDYVADESRRIEVEFVPDQATAVLSWGGHISSPIDWGDGNTASDITGSPYHTANYALKDAGGTTVASGSQDVQLSAAAVFVPSAITVVKESNAPGTFSFESFLDNTAIPPDGETNPWTLDKDQEKSIDAMDEGTVTISELGPLPEFWRIKSIICTKGGEGIVFSYVYGQDAATNEAEFEVDEASTFVCVFENEFYGAPVLNVIKRVVGPDDACDDDVRTDAQYDSRSIHSGEWVKYCYWVTNSGADAALDVTLEDDRGGLAADTVVALSGGSDVDGEGDAPDLAPGETLSGSLPVKLDVTLNTVVTNTATASGTGQYDGLPYMASDTAQVTADLASDCSLDATVYAGAGACPGTTTAYILKGSGTDANWCANVHWDEDAALDLTNILVTLEGTAVSNGAPDMAPNSSQHVAVGVTNPDEDFTGTLNLAGTEGNLNAIACSGAATVNVLDPGLTLIKLASTDNVCGNGDDAHDVEIYLGDPVWYCMTVMNTGDTPLENITISDNRLGGPIAVPNLGVGEDWTYKSAAQYPDEDVTNTATATSVEPLTGTPIDSDQSSATVTVLRADVSTRKSVDPDQFVLCDPPDAHDFCSEQDGSGIFAVSYTLVVHNDGPSIATGVDVVDELPFGFIYSSNDGGCDYDEPGHLLSCMLGDMAPGETIEIEVTGEIDIKLFEFPWQRVTNQACANTAPPRLDPDPSNNCDTASTHINTGPTRTIGWWKTHTYGREACAATGDIDLGFLVIRDETVDNEIDATVSTDPLAKGKFKSSLITAELAKDDDNDITDAVAMMKGLLNAGTSKWGDGTKRSKIGQARVQAGRQLAAAWCNEAVFFSEFDSYFLGWDNIQAIMRGEAYLSFGAVQSCGGPCDKKDLNKVIDSIRYLGGIADLFNNSGDALDNGLAPEPANPGAPEDDPTDPSD